MDLSHSEAKGLLLSVGSSAIREPPLDSESTAPDHRLPLVQALPVIAEVAKGFGPVVRDRFGAGQKPSRDVSGTSRGPHAADLPIPGDPGEEPRLGAVRASSRRGDHGAERLDGVAAAAGGAESRPVPSFVARRPPCEN